MDFKLYSPLRILVFTTLSTVVGFAQADDRIEEVIVSAEKREAALQSVPTSVSILDGVDAAKINVQSLEDYAGALAGLNYVTEGFNRNKFFIRGVSEGIARDYQIASPVAIYIDDMPLTNVLMQPDLHIVDVARIELLRGPQGTLYGNSSMGGALKFITNKPDISGFQGTLSSSYATTKDGGDSHRLDAVINLPTGERSALRLVAYTKTDGGYIDYTTLQKDDFNEIDTEGGRIAWRWLPNDRLDINLRGMWQDSQSQGRNWHAPALSGLQFDGPIDENQDYSLSMADVSIQYQFERSRLVSVTTGYSSTNDDYFDFSSESFVMFEPVFLVAGITPSVAERRDMEFDVLAHETRWLSASDQALRWTAGLFYSKDELVVEQSIIADQMPELYATLELLGGPAFGAPESLLEGGEYYIAENLLFLGNFEIELERQAVFAQVDYDLTEALTATLGLRWYDVDVESIAVTQGIQNLTLGQGDPDNIGLTPNIPLTQSEDDVIPKASLQYRYSDDLIFSALISRGFRSGGANPSLSVASGAPPTWESDDLWNYELGMKGQWFEGAWWLNVALYYVDWENMITAAQLDSGFAFRTNAGDASIKGIELESAWLISSNLRLNVALNVQDPTLEDDYCLNLTSVEPCSLAKGDFQGVSGDQLLGVAKSQYSFAMEYSRPIKDSLLFLGILEYRHVGETFTEYAALIEREEWSESDYRNGDFELVNLHFLLQSKQGWKAGLFVKNLDNERAKLNSTYHIAALSPDINHHYINRPRTVGINLEYSF